MTSTPSNSNVEFSERELSNERHHIARDQIAREAAEFDKKSEKRIVFGAVLAGVGAAALTVATGGLAAAALGPAVIYGGMAGIGLAAATGMQRDAKFPSGWDKISSEKEASFVNRAVEQGHADPSHYTAASQPGTPSLSNWRAKRAEPAMPDLNRPGLGSSMPSNRTSRYGG